MEFRHIRSFLSVAETLGRSARLLHLSQPALSLQVKALEEELGVDSMPQAATPLIISTYHGHKNNSLPQIAPGDSNVA